MAKKKGLGKGLSALLENVETDITTKNSTPEVSKVLGSISNVPIELIEANPFQPRTHFEEEPLLELADSIKQHGVIQPITIRKIGYDKFQIISGERRFRAAQIAEIQEIPAYIRVANDQTMLEMAIVENVQREDLDPIEVALSYQRLIEECKLTQEALSKKVGKSRSNVTNFLRLLKLPPEVQLGIREKKLSMGHARALINIENEKDRNRIFQRIVEEGLSVREVENLSKANKKQSARPPAQVTGLSFEDQKIKDDLTSFFGTKIDLKRKTSGKGKIEISFSSENELQRIIDRLNG